MFDLKVSRSSWHYRLYAQIKWFWAKFLQRDSVNENPGLFRYVSTILAQGPATGAAALIAQIFRLFIMIFAVIGKIWNFCTATSTRKLTLGALGFAAFNTAIFMIALYTGITPWGAATGIALAWASMAAIAVSLAACVLAFFVFIYFPVVMTVAVLMGEERAASFIQLTKTRVTDGAGKRFCLTLTFVD
jgi:hypothetical protein